MDSQNQQPAPEKQQPTVPQATTPATGQPYQSKLAVPDKTAQALLMINGLQKSPPPKNAPPLKLLIAIGIFVAVAVIASFLVSSAKPGGVLNSAAGSGSSSQSNSSATGSTGNQINSDTKSCLNPVNAVSEC